MPTEEERLEAEREQLYLELSKTGDFRRGSISTNYRRCGKYNCTCAKPEHPGHGPQYLLTTKIKGKSQAKNLQPGPVLEKVQDELANHQKFRELVKEIVEINEKICDIKKEKLQAGAGATAKKGASKTGLKRKSPPN